MDGACIDGACASGAYTDGAYRDRAYIDRAYRDGVVIVARVGRLGRGLSFKACGLIIFS